MAGLRDLFARPDAPVEQYDPFARQDPEAQRLAAQAGMDAYGGDLGRGYSAGMLGGVGAGYYSSLGAAQEGLGYDPTRSYNTARELLRRAGAAAPAVNNWDQVHGPYDFARYTAGAIGNAAASYAPGLAATALTRSPRVGLATMFPMEMGETVAQTRLDPTRPQPSTQDLLTGSVAKGAVNTALESVPFLNVFGKGPLRPMMKSMGAPGRVLSHMGAEGLTEAAQQVVGNTAQSYLDPTRDTSGDMGQIRESFLQGALGSAPFAGMSALSHTARDGGDGVQNAFGRGREWLDKTFPARGKPTPLEDLLDAHQPVAEKLADKFDGHIGETVGETLQNLQSEKKYNLMRKEGFDSAEDDVKKSNSFLRQQLGHHSWMANQLAPLIDRYLAGDNFGKSDRYFQEALVEAFGGNAERAQAVLEHFNRGVIHDGMTQGERTTIHDVAKEPTWGDGPEQEDDQSVAELGGDNGGQEYAPRNTYRFAGTGRMRPYATYTEARKAGAAMTGGTLSARPKVVTLRDWALDRGKDVEAVRTHLIGDIRYEMNDLQARIDRPSTPKEEKDRLRERYTQLASLMQKAMPRVDPDTGEVLDSAHDSLSKLFVLRNQELPNNDLAATAEEISQYADKREKFGGSKGSMLKFKDPNGKTVHFNARQILDVNLKGWGQRNSETDIKDSDAHMHRVLMDGISRLVAAGYTPPAELRKTLIVRDGKTLGDLQQALKKESTHGDFVEAQRENDRAIQNDLMPVTRQELEARRAEGWQAPEFGAPEGNQDQALNFANREVLQGPEGNAGEGFDPEANTLRAQDAEGPRGFDENIVTGGAFQAEPLDTALRQKYGAAEGVTANNAKQRAAQVRRGVPAAPVAAPQASTGSNLEKLQGIKDAIEEHRAELEARGEKTSPKLRALLRRMSELEAERTALTKEDVAAEPSVADNAARAENNRLHEKKLKKEEQDSLDAAIGRKKFNREDYTAPAEKDMTAEERKAVIDELVRVVGKDIEVAFPKFANLGGRGSYEQQVNGKRVIEIAIDLALSDAMSTAHHESMHDLFALLYDKNSTPEMRNAAATLMRVTQIPHIRKQMRELLKDHPDALKQIDGDPENKDPMKRAPDHEEAAAYLYQFWKAGLIKDLAPAAKNIFEQIAAWLRKVLGIVSQQEKALKLMQAFDEGKFADRSMAGAVIAEMKLKTARQKLEQLGGPIFQSANALMTSVTDRMHMMDIKAIGEIAEALHQDIDHESGRLAFIQRRGMMTNKWSARMADKVIGDATPLQLRQALEILQRRTESDDPLVKKIRKYFDDMHAYLAGAGVTVKEVTWSEKKDDKTGEISWEPSFKDVPISERKVHNYFPRVWDSDYIAKNKAEFIDALREHGKVNLKNAEEIWESMQRDDQIDLADGAAYTPYLMAANARKLHFINEANAPFFAKFQKKDLVSIMSTYTYQAVHRAEYARRFGNDGEWIENKLAEARKQGATEEQLSVARQGVAAMLGTLGHEMPTGMRKLYTSLMAYENIALLPFALINNFMDVMQIGLRSGDLTESWNALKMGVKGLAKAVARMPKSAQEDFANDIGLLDENAELASYGMAYDGSYMTGFAKRVSDKFFKWNGMQTWNTQMRVAGMMAGMRFIQKHAELAKKGDEQSLRFLRELNLKPEDVETIPRYDMYAKKAGERIKVKEEDGLTRAQATKMQEALYRFVDGAVLRPNAAHRPIWGSDPHWMLVFHLKQFTFSFQQVVLRYMQKEMQHGNSFPAIALMGYVPFAMVTDMARSALVGRPIDWSLGGMLGTAVKNSAVLGTGTFTTDAWVDATKTGLVGTSFLGPTAGHAIQVMQTIAGVPGSSADKLLLRSIPAGPLFRAVT